MGPMRTRLTLKPGQRGTKKLLTEYGERLVCVRYRYDEQSKKRYKTVELIIEEVAWKPVASCPASDTVVEIRVEWEEMDIRKQVKGAGGRWNAGNRVWELRYDQVERLGLVDRLVGEKGL